MPITLTCSCGQKQNIANEMSATAFACLACGKALTMPALEKIVPSKAKRAKAPRETPSSSRFGALLLSAGAIVLLFSAGGILTWAVHRNADEPAHVAQNQQAEPNEPPSVERKRPEPAVILPIVQPVKPPVADAAGSEKPAIEPVRQVGALPNPFVPPIMAGKEPIVEKKPTNVIEPLKLMWKLKADDTFFQELIVTQQPTFKVQGVPIAMMLKYRIVSRFTVKKQNDDGSLLVEQKIETAKLLQADDLTKPAIAGALEQLPGRTYRLALSPKMDVTKFEAVAAEPLIKQIAGGFGLQLTSLIDQDGWKELNQATFFQMDQPLKANARWSKPLKHNWGSLGSWSGQIHYLYAGQQAKLHKVAYGLQLKYQAPNAGAVGIMKINNANFQTQQAEGVLFFDSVRGRVTYAEERFRVKGFINANLLGQNTMVEIDEDQHFLIRIHDKLD